MRLHSARTGKGADHRGVTVVTCVHRNPITSIQFMEWSQEKEFFDDPHTRSCNNHGHRRQRDRRDPTCSSRSAVGSAARSDCTVAQHDPSDPGGIRYTDDKRSISGSCISESGSGRTVAQHDPSDPGQRGYVEGSGPQEDPTSSPQVSREDARHCIDAWPCAVRRCMRRDGIARHRIAMLPLRM